MMKILLFLASAAVLAFAQEEVVKKAIVRIDGAGVIGNITFTAQEDGNVLVNGRIIGMPPGMYGFHVHEKGDITNGCEQVGSHYNPYHKDHGHPSDENRHVGDLGNVKFDESGAEINFSDHQIKLSGPCNIIGRAVVLHQRSDDFGRTDHVDSRKTGNAGPKIACGVIGIAETQPAASDASTILKTSLLTLSVVALIL